MAVLGLGPMGQALAATLVSAGRPTVVWNRTPDKARALVARGATLAPTVADAVRQASLVICCVMNYDAARASLVNAADRPAATLVNLTSGHSGEARAMAAWAGERGIGYLDGAILTPAPTIGTTAATILYSGPRPVFDDSRATLDTLGGAAIHLGDDIGAAAAYEMALLDLFAMSVGGLAHAFALATAEGIPPAAFARFAKGIWTLLPDMIDRFAGQLAERRFPGSTSSIATGSSRRRSSKAMPVVNGTNSIPAAGSALVPILVPIYGSDPDRVGGRGRKGRYRVSGSAERHDGDAPVRGGRAVFAGDELDPQAEGVGCDRLDDDVGVAAEGRSAGYPLAGRAAGFEDLTVGGVRRRLDPDDL